MKKLIIFVLAVCICQMATARDFTLGGVTYSEIDFEPGKCIIKSYLPSRLAGDVTLPAEVTFGGETYSVTGIEEYAFEGCNGVTSFTLPASLEYVGRNAFQECGDLVTVIFPQQVTRISPQTFYGCASLKTFTGRGVQEVGEAEFFNCFSLSSVSLAQTSLALMEGAFRNCRSLRTFSVPEDSGLWPGVFSGCESLATVTLPQSLLEIPDFFFSDCVSLSTIRGGSGVISVGSHAFYHCSSLAAFPFPEGLEEIGESGFGFCSALDFGPLKGESMIIRRFAFAGCESLRAPELRGVAEIEEEAFSNCYEMQSVSFGPDIYRIADRAFRGSDNIREVICEREQPPFLGITSFSQQVYADAILFVPEGYRLLYMQSPPWSFFFSVDDSGIEETESQDMPVITKEDDGITVSGPAGWLTVVAADGRVVSSFWKEETPVKVDLSVSGLYVVSLGGRSVKIVF